MLFSLFDVKVGCFGPLFEARTSGEARRNFLTAYLNGKDSMLTNYPDDFVLYEVGDFNIDTGIVTSYDAPVKVISGFEIAKIAKRGEEVTSDEVTSEACNTCDSKLEEAIAMEIRS